MSFEETKQENRTGQEAGQGLSGQGVPVPDLPEPDWTCEVCGQAFVSEKSLMGHRLGKHHLKPQYQAKEEDLGGPYSPPSRTRSGPLPEDPRSEEAQDLRAEVRLLELEKQRLEKLARIQRLDPGYGRPSPPNYEDPDIVFLTGLRKKELFEAEIAKVQAQTEACRQPPQPIFDGQYEEVTEYIDKNGNLCGDPEKAFSLRSIRRPIASAPRESTDVRELKEEVKALSQKLEDEKFSSLKTSFDIGLTSLRNEIKANSSELRVLIESATDLAKTWIASPGPVAVAGMSRLGFEAITEPIPQAESTPEASREIIDGLREHGFTARIIERDMRKQT